jgi:hypothetical protein
MPTGILIGTTTDHGKIDPFTATIALPVAVRATLDPMGRAVAALSAQLGDSIRPSTDGSWGLGSSAPRFLPWIVLLAVAWLVRMVAAAVLADRTSGPRRRRWTSL